MTKRKADDISCGEPRAVLCYGDSNTWGATHDLGKNGDRIPYASRWTTILQQGLGDSFIVVPEGLSGRTTVVDDPYGNPDFAGVGGQGMNGHRFLLPCMHSHKPLALVVIGLGTNDLKAHFSLTPSNIATGVRTLIHTVRRSNAGEDGGAPKVLVVSPALVRDCHPVAETWGFVNCKEKSRKAIAAVSEMCEEEKVAFVDLSVIADTGEDGVHFSSESARTIGDHMLVEVKKVLEL